MRRDIADRVSFLLKHRTALEKVLPLLRPGTRGQAPPTDALNESDLMCLLAICLPRLGHIQTDLSRALSDIEGALREQCAGDSAEALTRLVHAISFTPDKRLAFYEKIIAYAQATDSEQALRVLAGLLEQHGKAYLAVHLPRKLVPTVSFHNLCALEAAWLSNGDSSELSVLEVEQAGTQREPWVAFPSRDYLGLALSGGGIRSATFNLGLLQGLAELGILNAVDYVSTVSGGGYIGGFWTACRYHDEVTSFPRPAQAQGTRREPPSIRHLREFSRFLIPRIGFAQSETWNAVVAVLGGTLASLIAILTAIVFVLYIWQFATRGLAMLDAQWGGGAFGTFTAAALMLMQYRILHVGKVDDDERESPWPWLLSALAGAAAWAAWYALGSEACTGKALVSAVAIGNAAKVGCIFAPALAWAGGCMFLYLIRGLTARWSGLRFSTALDRTLGRCLALSALIGALGLAWIVGTWLLASSGDSERLGVAGTLGAIATAIFVWLADWLRAPVQETNGGALLTRFARAAKPLLPQLAANVVMALMIVGMAMVVQLGGFGSSPDLALALRCALASLVVVGGALVFFDPARIGLHDFYRARLSRCFLGAARAHADKGPRPRPAAVAVEEAKDDITLGQLRARRSPEAGKATRGPLHLICCAANNLSGDQLGNLYRGARSAVLSPFGIAVGSVSAPRDDLRLSAALTASAAAFNSQMGNISVNMGPAVAFVMCALNLRLGLWVPHPVNPTARRAWTPGWHFFLEALGMSRSDQVNSPGFLSARTVAGRAASYIDRNASKLHLSDGGHFENLALYELIRRHCRYIIVSDASADPGLSFDDLGNAIRRVREDFGVEVELDVSPLRRTEGGDSDRHAVIGTVHYDGYSGSEKGMIIYFKPTLTGDEPVDVLEHRVSHPHFPHDGTGDQFYDEQQWESYRRLGQHTAISVLSMPALESREDQVGRLFMLANQRWHPAPRDTTRVSLALVERCASFEAEVRDSAPAHLRAEFFPEVALALQRCAAQASASTTADEVTRGVYFVMQAAQLMEDIWLAADLEANSTHPLNEGWINYFHRWVATPSFHTWWPVLRPLYSPGFRDFVKEHFGLRLCEKARHESYGTELELRVEAPAQIRGLAADHWRARDPAPLVGATHALVYEMKLASRQGLELNTVLVGILVYTETDDCISWNSGDLFVPPTLVGAGIVSRFLDAIIDHFARCTLRVTLNGSAHAPAGQARCTGLAGRSGSAPRRRALVDVISFYKSRGFRHQPPEKAGEQSREVLERPCRVADAAQ